MKKAVLVFLCAIAALLCTFSVSKAEEQPIGIYTCEDLLQIADNPSGNYVLMADLDMSGIPWPAITFSGTFDGNQHYIINLNHIDISTETRATYDGNRKAYDTHFGGLFAILEKATVKNLKLVNFSYVSEYVGDCFLGGIAGYSNGSTIENCELSGTCYLAAFGQMFGVGGVIGYGNGVVKKSSVTVSLINVDLDDARKDEEFLGGICAAGYPDIDQCRINLHGYISDHGYVHSGGLVGMYIVYPKSFYHAGFLSHNKLEGIITFFEDNDDRRAYCAQRIGEIMDVAFQEYGNTYKFVRDERTTYHVTLLPHGDCTEPFFTETKVEPTCTTPGYTIYQCESCDYSYCDHYVLPAHSVSEEYTVIEEATLEAKGIGEGSCSVCGQTFRFELPKESPTPTPSPTVTPTPKENDTLASSPTVTPATVTTAPEESDTKDAGVSSKSNTILRLSIGIAVILLMGGAILTGLRLRRKRH